MLDNIWCDADKHFVDSLMEFLFSRISGDKVSHKSIYVLLCKLVHNHIYLWGLIRITLTSS